MDQIYTYLYISELTASASTNNHLNIYILHYQRLTAIE